MALDPVCGMTVDPARAAGQVDHDGTTYYFCSKGCVAKFSADPKKYLSGVREPMHHPPAPAVIQIGGLKRAQNSELRTQNSELRTSHPAPRTSHLMGGFM
jgi:YHS domain-containing protein